jgi:citrate lyase subunit beta / citryl-CoA lyase
MNTKVAIAGNSGPKIRSDCEVSLGLNSAGGIRIDLTSKVKALYGESIIAQTNEVMRYFGISDASISINDSGALPFVISARLEAAVKQLIKTDLEYLPEMLPENVYATSRDRFRLSRLYLPGNNPGLMINAGLHSADGLILDLEDSVAPEKKDEARLLVRNALRQISFCGSERMVRINQGEEGLKDLSFVIPHNVNLILIPKCESDDYIRRVELEIGDLKKKSGIDYPVFLMPIIETALGVENCLAIARASENVVSIAIGLEDYTADLGVQRTPEGTESLYARTRLVVAAKAAGIQPIDSVFSDVGDMEGLRRCVKVSRSLGFAGMGCIHPRQVTVIREGYAPEFEEIEKAKKIVLAYEDARNKGLGVVALGTKMIDLPVVTRAQKSLELAVKLGLLSSGWRDENPAGQTNEI